MVLHCTVPYRTQNEILGGPIIQGWSRTPWFAVGAPPEPLTPLTYVLVQFPLHILARQLIIFCIRRAKAGPIFNMWFLSMIVFTYDVIVNHHEAWLRFMDCLLNVPNNYFNN